MEKKRFGYKRLRRRYVRVERCGRKWNTYLRVENQTFRVVEQVAKRAAEWYGDMLAIALTRLVVKERRESEVWTMMGTNAGTHNGN